MFSSKQSNSKLEKIHECALRIISRNYMSDYSSLLEQSNVCTFHVRNLQALMTEIYKTIADLNPTFMKEIFIRQDTPYRLKCNLRLKITSVRTLSCGTESISFRGRIHYKTHIRNVIVYMFLNRRSDNGVDKAACVSYANNCQTVFIRNQT